MSLSVGSGASFGSVGGGGGPAVTGVAPISVVANAVSISVASQAAGDLLVFNGSSWTRVPAGSSGYTFQANGASLPTWVRGTTYVGAGTDNWESRRINASIVSLAGSTGFNNFGSDSTQAIPASSGNYSTIGGGNKNRVGGGDGCFVAGINNYVGGLYTTAFGQNQQGNASSTFLGGRDNIAAGEGAALFGIANSASGVCNFVGGYLNTASGGGYGNTIFGQQNTCAAGNNNTFIAGSFNANNAAGVTSNVLLGYQNTITADVTANTAATAIGWSNTVRSSSGTAIGNNNTVATSSEYAVALGRLNTAGAKSSLATGCYAQSKWEGELSNASGLSGNTLATSGTVVMRGSTPGSAANETVELLFGEALNQRLDLSKFGNCIWRARITLAARQNETNLRTTSFDVTAGFVGAIATFNATEVNPFAAGNGTLWSFTVDANPTLTSCVRVRFNTGATTATTYISARVDYVAVY